MYTELLDFLRNEFPDCSDWGDVDRDIAIWWYANHYHDGQWSPLYLVLCSIPYKPGPMTTLEGEGEMVEMMYAALVAEYTNPCVR